MKKLTRRTFTAKTFSKFTLGIALLGVALTLSIAPFGVEGKKAVQKEEGQRVQGAQVSDIQVATVDFQELARQQALNPQVSEPAPRAISAPMTIKEVDAGPGELRAASAQAEVDVPSPLIPSPGPANNYASLDDIPFAPPGQAFFTIPPDTMGAVGTDGVNKVLVTLNNNFRVQNKTTGAQIGGDVSMTNFWAPVGATNPFDPRVQYDPYNDRWILAGVSDSGTANTSILVGISTTNDPSGSYFLVRVSARIAADAANINFADFPMLGFNRNWIVVTINMFQTGPTAFSNGRALVIDYPTFRTSTFAGTYFTGVSAGNAGFCMHPATTYSNTENTEFLPSHQLSSGATYRLHTITGTPAAPVFTIGPLLVRPGGGWVNLGGNIVPQAQGTCATPPTRIESADAFIRSNVVFRNNSIWYPQTIGLPAGGATHTAVQWTQLDTAGAVLQGGRVDDPTATQTNGGFWYNYPSIAVNSKNDVLFGFSRFSSTTFASAGYTYRDGTDAAGTMRDPVIYKAGEDCYVKDFGSGRNRWGDYSHTMVDPTDDCSLWTIQEYAKLQAPPTVGGSSSKWGTWWARVNALAPCAAGAANGAVLVQESCPPVNGAIDPGETVTVNLRVMNSGVGPTTNLVGTLLPNANVLAPTGPHSYGVVAPGATAGRDYSFTANGSPGDTISLVLQLQDGANNLGSVTYTFVLGSNTACAGAPRIGISSVLSCGGSNTVATVTVSNTGTATANSVTLTTAKLGAVNGTPLPQNLGNIAAGASVVTNVTFAGAPSGVQILQIGGTHSAGTFNSNRKVNAPTCP